MIGWKKWWPETIKMAFLAPVFIFFMYIIIKFLDTGFSITQSWDELSGLNFVIAVTLPFIIIMVLMLKAKGIAKDMSGKLGEQITKAGAGVAGAAVGLAAGGAGLLARSTLGRWGSSIGENEKLKAAEAKGGIGGFMAGKLRNIGKAAGSGSFDVRNTAAMGSLNKVLKQTNTDLNIKQTKVGVGGFKKREADQKAKDIAKAKELELGENSKEKENLRKSELELQNTKRTKGADIERLEKEEEAKRKEVNDLKNLKQNDPKNVAKQEAYTNALKELEEIKTKKKRINDGFGVADENGEIKYNTTNGNISKTEHENIKKDYEKDKESSEKAKTKLAEDEAFAIQKIQEARDRVANAGPNILVSQAAQENLRKVTEEMGKMTEASRKASEAEEEKARKSKERLDQADSSAEKGYGKSIKELEAEVRENKKTIAGTNAQRRLDYAANITSEPTKWMRMFTSGLQYSTEGTDQAAHQIIMNTDVAAAGANQQR
jgi:hypothetical protein